MCDQRSKRKLSVFSRIQASRFRCLKSVDQRVGRFAALVGPNASGKSTFLDVIGFLGDLARTRGDIGPAVSSRSASFDQLLWLNRGDSFQLAIEAPIPEPVRGRAANGKQSYRVVRYEVEIGLDRTTNEIGLDHEALWLVSDKPKPPPVQRDLFPMVQPEPFDIVTKKKTPETESLIKKNPQGNDNFYAHGTKRFNPSFRLGRTKSALANLPEDDESFPIATWFRGLLERGVQSLVLNSLVLRRPSPPGMGLRFQPDGANLPWVVAELRRDERRFRNWLSHVRTGLEDIEDIETVERDEDKHRYLVIRYKNGARVPSWLVSDGTLRLLALTIPAYLSGMDGVYLIEEPENGIHPRAIETVVQSLASLYSGQVLMATHSPVALNILEPTDILCFAKDPSGATDIESGDRHPALKDWKAGQPDLGTLFAAGILS